MSPGATGLKWSALINPVTRDAPRNRLHLSIVEALNAFLIQVRETERNLMERDMYVYEVCKPFLLLMNCNQ
ncbi:hypothetical protein Y032_0091g2495 [Ancylostoma ceylanicum]|uniref:Uncharacterized protein n=1 Tax=Ancylostoma ceylanicum TaxID=53326 RepID=A0A016TMF9_9BILA|nr:hypothetical protein Y032_0091g2495 [Ancylostoma ceylanicum]